MPVATVSRARERQAVDDLLDATETEPAGLVIVGEPGIGKTTLWLAGLARAQERGFRVLSTRADEAESVLGYAAVADLLEDVEAEVLDGLHELQRVATDRVLLRTGTDGPPTDQRVTGSAVVAVVTALAAQQPILLAIDDAQWLDVSSRAVLAFAARRLTGRVAILLTARAHSAEAEPVEWLQLRNTGAVSRLRVGPLSLGALHTMILERFGTALPRPTMVRIAEISGGNPFYALELARGVGSGSATGDSVLPSTLTELVRLRTGHFDGTVGDLLLAACSVTEATVGLLAAVTGESVERVVELLERPEREEILRIDGSGVHFAHPLLARGIYTGAGPARRRRMHRALAAVEAHPELKARHMALGAASAGPETLHTLDAAAAAAVGRGAAAAAADLCELAIGLGGDTSARRLNAAEQHLRAGDNVRARRMLEPVIDGFEPGSPRAAALYLLGAASIADHDYSGALPLLGEAVEYAGEDRLLLVKAQLSLSRAESMTGDHGAARQQAKEAVAHAERLGDPKLISQAAALDVLLDCAHGMPRDEVALARALEFESPDPDVAACFRASVTDAVTTAWAGRFDEALAGLTAARRRCVEVGADADVVYVSGHLAMVYTWLGRYSVAVDVAQDILRRGENAGGGYPAAIGRTQRGLASAYLGRERVARDDAHDALAGARQCGATSLTMWSRVTLGFLETSLGNYAEALNALQPLLSHQTSGDILLASYLPDAIEAMVALGRIDEAVPLVEALDGQVVGCDRPWRSAIGGRCRGMLQAATGELAEAEESLQQAVIDHQCLPMPFERARTQLFLGQVLRRQRRKNLAAATLREALVTFEELKTPIWANRVVAELERTDAPRTNASHLTPSELRVARLAAAGMTNKDIASAMFISPKTVEHNLSSVYRKLAVRTRAELAGRRADLGAD
ncbi:AAA family ATPase [Mycolicibacterium hodleri]|uniref:Helix-turn-helix transcriptional regulator n=1 Tax=Mycolicibacterium hodleri TaxID=49897 RepID=A0A502EJ23_9MYCO|nr:LuxR family transcriptional regulator [Mycolicibacterium hodleri]TPG37049.1 helix-turn-helix transcriptional regulator [Mycolicibacterium hodleri]